MEATSSQHHSWRRVSVFQSGAKSFCVVWPSHATSLHLSQAGALISVHLLASPGKLLGIKDNVLVVLLVTLVFLVLGQQPLPHPKPEVKAEPRTMSKRHTDVTIILEPRRCFPSPSPLTAVSPNPCRGQPPPTDCTASGKRPEQGSYTGRYSSTPTTNASHNMLDILLDLFVGYEFITSPAKIMSESSDEFFLQHLHMFTII